MKKIVVSLGVVAVLLLGYFIFRGAPQKESADAIAAKPSVIVIDICSLRRDRLGIFGSQAGLTPNLDVFAKESAIFSNFWTGAEWCLPNFATLLTGMRAGGHKQTLVLPHNTQTADYFETLETLPEILRTEGFMTGGFSGSRYLAQDFWPSGNYASGGLLRGFNAFANPYRMSIEDDHRGAVSVEENFSQIQAFLAQKTDKPRFLYITIDDLHSPYRMDDADAARVEALYDGPMKNMFLSMRVMRLFSGEKLNDITADEVRAVEELKSNPKALQYVVARYDASVKRVDRIFGELVRALQDNNLWENSVVIVTSHQGEALGDRGVLGHASGGLAETILKVPLFIRYPGKTRGETVSTLAERVDIPATILDIAGALKNHPQFIGRSLLGWLGIAAPRTEKKYIVSESQRPSLPADTLQRINERAISDGRYKLVWDESRDPQSALYDVLADPTEQHDIARDFPEVFQRLQAELGRP